MKFGVDFLSPASSYATSSGWLLGSSGGMGGTAWTPVENKLFERALADIDTDTPDRWEKVASRVPGKTARDVMVHYNDLVEDVTLIDAGLVPLPGYNPSTFTLDWEDCFGFEESRHGPHGSVPGVGARRAGGKRSDHERKKGIPWTEEEHRRFLMGLKKYGKGDWRNISRNFVTTRTPTQVASHAQKYFIRLSTGGKDKRRSSIHDITTVNLTDEKPPPPSSSSPASNPPQARPVIASGLAERYIPPSLPVLDPRMLRGVDEAIASPSSSSSPQNPYSAASAPPFELKMHARGGPNRGVGVVGGAFNSFGPSHHMFFQMQQQSACLHPLG